MVIYIQLNEKIELTCKVLHFILARISYFGVMLPKLLKTIVNCWIYDDQTAGPYFLTFPVMLPFNWQTPCGYLIALLTQFAAAFAVLSSASAVLGFLVGSCLLFIDTVRDITTDLKLLNDDQSSSERSNNQRIKVRFCNIVKIYSNAKQLSRKTAIEFGVFFSQMQNMDGITYFIDHSLVSFF